MIFFIIASSQT